MPGNHLTSDRVDSDTALELRGMPYVVFLCCGDGNDGKLRRAADEQSA